MTERERDELRLELLELIYATPAPGVADQRVFHEDLPWLDEDRLKIERRRAQIRLDLDPAPSRWLKERVRLLEQACGQPSTSPATKKAGGLGYRGVR